MALLGLLLGKFLAYGAFFRWATRLLGIRPTDPGGFAIKWAGIRLALGLLAIIPTFLLGAVLAWIVPSSDALFYAEVYGIRALIWAGLAAEICRRQPSRRPIHRIVWVSLGLLINLLLDITIHAAGLDDFKYFC